MQSNVGGRSSNCIPSQGTRYTVTLNDMVKWNREILESVRRNERLDEGELAKKFENDYHEQGHVIISQNCDNSGDKVHGAGIMANAQASARDPVFYRWHKHIDDIAQMWYDTQPA